MANPSLTPDFRDLLKCLNACAVEYLVIGGYAVMAYGFVRTTKDLDVWIATGAENIRRFGDAMDQFIGQHPPADQVRSETFLLRLGRAPNMIEVMTTISGVVFSECYPRRVIVEVDGIAIPFIGLKDLRANKAASGRLQDLADLDNLPEAESGP